MKPISAFVGPDEIDVAHSDRLGEFVERDDRRIALAALQATQILLAKARP